MRTSDPLVVTLALDNATQERFDAERRMLFPAGRTQVGAHVTLFHALPGEQLDAVVAALTVEQRNAVVDVSITGIRNLGRGAAYSLESATLLDVHARLSGAWAPWLTAQDRQRFRPHITVQNKAEPQVARETVTMLTAAFTSSTIRGTGLQLWRYVGGPWEFLRLFPFRSS